MLHTNPKIPNYLQRSKRKRKEAKQTSSREEKVSGMKPYFCLTEIFLSAMEFCRLLLMGGCDAVVLSALDLLLALLLALGDPRLRL
jgi:hypothetical protein